MKSSGKFGILDLLLSIGCGFAFSFMLAAGLWVTDPYILAGLSGSPHKGLEEALQGLLIVFVGGGILFSFVVVFGRAAFIRRRSRLGNSSEGWWPTPRP